MSTGEGNGAMTAEQKAALIAEMNTIDWWHSIELPALGVTTPGREPSPRSRDAYMRIPWDQMAGKTVLDVGAWDGLYSFEAEKHGAAPVFALDLYLSDKAKGIRFAGKVLDSPVGIDYWDCERTLMGHAADFVLFFGVLYHLKNPYLALQNLFEVLKPGGLMIVETALMSRPVWSMPGTQLDISPHATFNFHAPEERWQQWAARRAVEDMPLLEFCEGERDGDSTNWNYPNRAWVEAALRSIGYVDIECTGGAGNRAAWHARRPT